MIFNFNAICTALEYAQAKLNCKKKGQIITNLAPCNYSTDFFFTIISSNHAGKCSDKEYTCAVYGSKIKGQGTVRECALLWLPLAVVD